MYDFFKPWRRKIGVVTLVMACACLVWWVRGSVAIAGLSDPSIEFEIQSWENFFALLFCIELTVISTCLLLARQVFREST